MKTASERNHESWDSFFGDLLGRYRKTARRALSDPSLELSDDSVVWEDVDPFDPEVAIAFARVARFLADIEPGSVAFATQRDAALRFISSTTTSWNAPLIDNEEGQLVRLDRGESGTIVSVTVMRSDEKPVTSADLRFSFRTVREFDAGLRTATAELTKANVMSPLDAVVEREKRTQTQIEAMTGDEKYRHAAELYEEARRLGYRTTRHLIMEEMYVSYNYAGQLVKRARDKGYLPPIERHPPKGTS